MKTDSGKKRDNKHNGQIRPVLCLLALALLASAILLTGLNLTGKENAGSPARISSCIPPIIVSTAGFSNAM